MEKCLLSHNYSVVPTAARGGYCALFFALLFIISSVNCSGALFDPPVKNASFELNVLEPQGFSDSILEWYDVGWAWEQYGGSFGVPVALDGNQFGGFGGGASIYQQIGTWTGSQNCRISLIVGHREGHEWGDMKISLWVGGNPTLAGDDVSVADTGAIMTALTQVNPFSEVPLSYIGTAAVEVELETGSGFNLGDSVWLNLEHTTGGQYFIDKVQVEASTRILNPFPADGADHVNIDSAITWTVNEPQGYQQNLHFGQNPDSWDVSLTSYSETSFSPAMDYATTYYWQVEIVSGDNTYGGPTWQFTTGGRATDPVPADGTEDLDIGRIDLSWTGDSFATSYKVYFGTGLSLQEIAQTNQPRLSGVPVGEGLTAYYWRVDTYIDDVKITEGDVWSLSTLAKPRPCIPADLNGDCHVNLHDLVILSGYWLDDAITIADLNDDDKTNIDDLCIIAENWQKADALSVVISEFGAVNKSTLPISAGEILDEDDDSSDWIEIHNMTDSTVNLDGWYLTNRMKNLKEWEFPEVTIPADGYLVVFASGKNRRDPASELHTNFSIAGAGEYLGLVKPDGVTIAYDYKKFPQQYAYITFGLSDTGSDLHNETVLIGEHVPATAFIPTDDSLGLTWTELDFDDSGWLAGQTGVGYDTGTRYTPLLGLDVLGMRNENKTVYVRIPFEVDDVSSIDKLTLWFKYEDGFVAYLNGEIVAQNNNPDLSELTFDSGSTANHDDSLAEVAEEFDITAYKSYLRQGANVLAIHGLNWQIGSSDLLILPRLTSVASDSFNLGTLASGYFFNPTPGKVNSTAITNLGPSIMDVTDNPPRPGDPEDLTITAGIEKTLGDIGSVVMHYRVMYGNEVSVQMADDGQSGDGEVGDGVYAATIPSNTFGPGQMIRWYITASDTLGKTSRAPLFPYPTDSAEYFGTVADDDTISTQLPMIEWFVNNISASQTQQGARGSVYYKGRFYDNIKISLRGGSTASAYGRVHQKFTFNRGSKFEYDPSKPKVNEFNLNHTHSDKAYLRQPLAFAVYDWCGGPGSISFPMRAQRNAQFHGVFAFIEEPEEEMLEREGLDPNGALYKMNSTFTRPGEKKTRRWEGTSDLSNFINDINNTSGVTLHNHIFDQVDLPRTLNYLVATVLVHQNDHPHKNHYLYRDSDGSGEWFFMPWDHDLTFGSNWIGTSFSDTIYADDDQVPGRGTHVKPSHPFIGRSDACEWNNFWNNLTDALLRDSTVREMFKRRLRTVMDDFLQPPDTPAKDLFINNKIDEMVAVMAPDVALDYNKWANPWRWGSNQSFQNSINILKNEYLEVRRTHLYITHNINNVGSYNISNSFSAELPDAQPANPSIRFGGFDYCPSSYIQDEEYIEIVNNENHAVDITGWLLEGGIQHKFLPGTVIPAGGSLYVSPNSRVFRQRGTSPTGGEGNLVQGNYKGHLSSWGETVNLLNRTSTIVDTLTTPSNPTRTQRYLRITEIMFNPDITGSSDSQDYEYIELKNIGDSDLDLMGLSFTEGILYSFTDMADTTVLAAGEYLIIAKNPTAFSSYYTDVPEGTVVLGPYVGQLSNNGEHVKLEDHTHSTILEFGYNDKWFGITDGSGFSLTVRDDSLADLTLWDEKAGWRPSALTGGSPGWDDSGVVPQAGAVVINEVLAHSHADFPDWVELHNTTNTPIPIGGWFLSDSSDDLMKYKISADVVIPEYGYVVFYEDKHFGESIMGTGFALSEGGETLYLQSGNAFGELTGYSEEETFDASESNVAFGRYQKSTGTYNFVAMKTNTPGWANSDPKVGPVVITEINYNPGTGPDDQNLEFIELKNISGSAVILQSEADTATGPNPGDVETEMIPWAITNGINFRFPAQTELQAGEYLLLVRDLEAFNTHYTNVPAGTKIFQWTSGSLDNGGEKIDLSIPGDQEWEQDRYYIRLDRVNYDDIHPWPVNADGTGFTLNRIKDALYGNDVGNWQGDIPSPGRSI